MSERRGSSHLRFVAAGTVDACGLAFGWTVFTLAQLHDHGLRTVAEYNSAMLVGIVLAAPVTGWARRRWSNRALLRGVTVTEATLRVVVLLSIGASTSTGVLAVAICAMNVAAWSGYACMRAEVVGHGGERAAALVLSRYGGMILAAEGLGASLAALSWRWALGSFTVRLVIAAIYALSLLPTLAVSRLASTDRALADAPRASIRRGDWWILASSVALTAVAAGPILLYVALAEQFWGAGAVIVAAAAVTLGALMAPIGLRAVAALRLPEPVEWALWSFGLVIGWAVADLGIVTLAMAAWLSGLSVTAFESLMDHRLTGGRRHGDGRITASLARGAASRALGGAVAVRMLPIWMSHVSLTELSIGGAIVAAALAAAGISLHPARPTATPSLVPNGVASTNHAVGD